jgi:hypothetical protein
MRINFLY